MEKNANLLCTAQMFMRKVRWNVPWKPMLQLAKMMKKSQRQKTITYMLGENALFLNKMNGLSLFQLSLLLWAWSFYFALAVTCSKDGEIQLIVLIFWNKKKTFKKLSITIQIMGLICRGQWHMIQIKIPQKIHIWKRVQLRQVLCHIKLIRAIWVHHLNSHTEFLNKYI